MDCRCDEQGRFCCLLEPEHWDALCALQKPSVEFFTSREALDARHASPPAAAFPPTPSYSAGTPQTVMSVPSTPTPTNGIHFVHTTGEHFADTPSPARGVPVFGMMGLGAPMGDHHRGQDVLTWDGQSPPAPLEFQPYSGFKQSEMALPASPIPFSAPLSTPYPYIPPSDPNFAPQDFVPVTQSLHDLTLPSQDPIPSTLDFDKMMADYFSYQFPSAICQNCGMNGCTCRNCPAVMQNFESGSWAQCCSRKHVRYAAQVPMPGTQAAHPEGHVDGQGASQVAGLQGALDPTFTQDMQVDDLKMLDDGTQPMDLSEFLLNDLEEQRPSGGCCCGD
ncbi:hypothetical protein LTR09_007199 [Extremus antarcticus]|uniref:Uncharacterized protein n=1 Tax=Extremus antarcticus TaxID=702011 RepID=A0AAJ0DD52_9PEZI|nr:hypothetical protein LTR09_007199 [Extremus antarcticus]